MQYRRRNKKSDDIEVLQNLNPTANRGPRVIIIVGDLSGFHWNVCSSMLGDIVPLEMFVDDTGDVTITNDGATILKMLEVEHPAAKQNFKTKKLEMGRTSVVIIAAELLKLAMREACKYVDEKLAVKPAANFFLLRKLQTLGNWTQSYSPLIFHFKRKYSWNQLSAQKPPFVEFKRVKEHSDDVAELEWLSNYMDDSITDFPANSITSAAAAFHGSSRSIRSRSFTSSFAGTTTWRSTSPPKNNVNHRESLISSGKENAEKGRRCTHCSSEKTPQWRTGPMGPKTLCNACGVRYKSGRLVPEYRPAASPTFVLTQHSNSHRKVLELRRQKELLRQQQLQSQRCNIGITFRSGDVI
ncbi:GATA transcription factor [Forsythia ovata]|uniref:GATA transcription factor n=1 Tax=Forsythia ovata TaxID=205694 RepID=A0ABD1VGT9_9LAMI